MQKLHALQPGRKCQPCNLLRTTILLQLAELADVDLSKVGTTRFGSFEVEVVDYTTEYFDTLKVRRAAGQS
jgi:hypothetical protein